MSSFTQQTNLYLQQIKSGINSILVSIRVRPLNQQQLLISQLSTIKILQGRLLSLVQPNTNSSNHLLQNNKTKEIQYAFDFIFSHQTTTKTIYQQNISLLVDGLLQGYNASVLAYGATSCGKTYTMVGQNTPGLMAMTVLQLLNKAKINQKYQTIKLKASYLEIYNQNIKDLLIAQDKNLQIRQHPKQSILTIVGLTQVPLTNINQLKTILKVANKNRTKQKTTYNQISSRSHGILQINIEIKNNVQSTLDSTIVSKLIMVDLAGSERASRTTNSGLRMVQGAKINQSLLVLGNCIKALSDASQKSIKNPFVPYRGSKLTRLLKDALGGNCRTVLIAHVSPALSFYQQTYNTLLYAHRAKSMKNNPIRNILLVQTHLSNYVSVINNLKRQNQQLKLQIQHKQFISSQKDRYGIDKSSLFIPTNHTQIYNQQIIKYQSIINKYFDQLSALSKTISQLNITIQKLSYNLYQNQLNNSNNKQLAIISNQQISQLTNQKTLLQQQYQLKQQEHINIFKQINKNNILGHNGINFLNNYFKNQKISSIQKLLSFKDNLIKQQKLFFNNFYHNIKNSLKFPQQPPQKQKPLIKKNIITTRIISSNPPITPQIHLPTLSPTPQRKLTIAKSSNPLTSKKKSNTTKQSQYNSKLQLNQKSIIGQKKINRVNLIKITDKLNAINNQNIKKISIQKIQSEINQLTQQINKMTKQLQQQQQKQNKIYNKKNKNTFKSKPKTKLQTHHPLQLLPITNRNTQLLMNSIKHKSKSKFNISYLPH